MSKISLTTFRMLIKEHTNAEEFKLWCTDFAEKHPELQFEYALIPTHLNFEGQIAQLLELLEERGQTAAGLTKLLAFVRDQRPLVAWDEVYEPSTPAVNSSPPPPSGNLTPAAPPSASGATPTTKPPCPFVVHSPVHEREQFIGRAELLKKLANRLNTAQPVHVNIWGPAGHGKSSLLLYFVKYGADYLHHPGRFWLGYLDLKTVNSATPAVFYRAILHLIAQQHPLNTPAWQEALQHRTTRSDQFLVCLQELKEQKKLIPVLGLDEFEHVLNPRHSRQFDNDFFDFLVSVMRQGLIVLFVASQTPIKTAQGALVSNFFTNGEGLKMPLFEPTEVDALLQLPHTSQTPHLRPVLGLKERELAQKWGGNHPAKLQAAAWSLYHNPQEEKAAQEFAELVQDLPQEKQNWWLWLKWLVWGLPLWLGQMVKKVGLQTGDITSWLLGVTVLVLPLLLGVGWLLGWWSLPEMIQALTQ